MSLTCADLIRRGRSLYGDQTALSFEHRRFTFAEQAARMSRLANALRALGLRRQERVAILARNCSEYIEIFGACELAGFVAINLNIRLSGPEIAAICQDCQPNALIHANDASKVIRAIEVSLAARSPITEQWSAGRDALAGYRVLRLMLAPDRAVLYERINQRAAAMFTNGLIEETRGLLAQFGPDCRPFASLGYAEASSVLRGELSEAEAVAKAQQGHRNFAKRQMTWFRKEGELHAIHMLRGMGDSAAIQGEAIALVGAHLGSQGAPRV